MPRERDPLSVRYDRTTGIALRAAIKVRPREQAVFVATPGPNLRQKDRGGLTVNERAFTRSAYYRVRSAPINAGQPVQWSLKMTWGKLERRGSRYGRVVKLRMYAYGSGRAHVRQHQRTSWAEHPELRRTAS